MDWNAILANVTVSWLRIYPLVVNVVLGLFLLLAGLLVARGLGWLTTAALKIIQLDRGSKAAGFNRLLEKGEVKKTASELLGDLVYWLVVLVAVIATVSFLGLTVEPLLTIMKNYLAIVFLAILTLGLGAFLASLISGLTLAVLANVGVVGAKTISRLIYYVVIIFAFLTALSQLGIGLDAFQAQIGVIIGAFGLAAAIAFGLGCKDMAADFLHNLFKGK